jgi:hypothetical protein
MSTIGGKVIEQFEKTLIDREALQPEFAKSIRKELEQTKGPNPERLADLFKKAANGSPA